MEQPAFDRGALEDRALGGLEAVDAGREERGDRRGDCLHTGVGIVRQHREQLLHEQRIALGRSEHPFAQLRRQIVLAEQFVDEGLRRCVVERLERHQGRVRLGGPRRSRLEQVGPCQADDQDRGGARSADDVLEEVEHRRLGPVNVVDDEDERPGRGDRLEEASEGPGRLFG